MIEHSVENFISELASEGRILLIGGLAVIAHGLSRGTKDADIWFEPFETPKIWADKINSVLKKFENASLFDVFENKKIQPENLADHIFNKKMIRINGLERWLDIFREPNNLKTDDFNIIWNTATPFQKTRLPLEEYLLQTKYTNRYSDERDTTFLEKKIFDKFSAEIKIADYNRAKEIFDIFAYFRLFELALENPNPKVKDLAIKNLKEFAKDGDPFSAEILEKHQIS